ncbi:MAG: amidophosphoribosyltransferase [Actinobacteria bacterium HGW-Actinobacteria-1]|jgi:amidophosphoribosyltransferase|nr:MAG: amidophosphoribosyltransferase [Actinobacteria bacterium HGW-Actinobacteria-1]
MDLNSPVSVEQSSQEWILEERPDRPEEACGVFAVYGPGEDVARLTYFGLHALQHRGQESAGIAVADGHTLTVVKSLGLVPQAFKESDLATLQGHLAIGHTRYSTTGSSSAWENAQPMVSSIGSTTIALAHNGNLVNTVELRDALKDRGIRFRSTTDSEVIATLVDHFTQQHGSIRGGIRETMKYVRGAYSVVLMSEEAVYAFRDPYGVRPLSLGKLNDTWVIASETCGLDIIGAEYVRDIAPGEMVKIGPEGLESEQAVPAEKPSLCIFEFIYFARPDSVLNDCNLYEARMRMGAAVARSSAVEADIVIGVPDSGVPAAVGYAKESGIPFGEGLVKNRYVGRTFISPSQSLRQQGIRLKLNPLRHVINGKRLIVVDDSIVRGNTSRKLVALLRESGATEVHMRITSPPVKWPCFYGIDTDTQEQLIAASKSVEEVREFIGADSLAYLSVPDMIESTGGTAAEYCAACFTGEYPVEIPDSVKRGKLSLEPVG